MGCVVWFVAEKHAVRLRGAWEGLGVLDTQTAPPWLESVVGAPKGRRPKKQQGGSAQEMQRVRDALEISRARGIAPAEADAIGEVVDRSALGEDAKVRAGSNKPSIRGLDASSDDGCVVGGRSSGYVSVEAEASAVGHEASGAVMAVDATARVGSNKPPIRGLDDSSDDGYVDGGGISSAVHVGRMLGARPRRRIQGLDDSSDDNCGVVGGDAVGSGLGTKRVLHRSARHHEMLQKRGEESLVYQPDDVDPEACQALSNARVQCRSAKVRGNDFCRKHQHNQYNGNVRGAPPAEVLKKFRDAAVRAETKNRPKDLYSRLQMW